MAEHLLGQRQIGRHQEGRPIDRVKADDVLADQVDVGRPEAGIVALVVGKADAGHVGRQRVDPDVHDVARRARHRHAPVEAGARDAQILEAAFDEADHFVAAGFRAG